MALTDSLVAYWKFEGNGNDSVGANNLTAVNSPTYTTGKKGQAASLVAASSQYFSINDNAALSTGDMDFTWSLWFNLASLTAGYFIAKYTSGNTGEYNIQWTGTALRMQILNGTTNNAVTMTVGLSTGTWYHVIGYHDSVADRIGLVLNNGTPTTAATTIVPVDSASPFTVGARASGNTPISATIDEVAFWKRMLTSTERTQLYNGGAGLTYPFGGVQRVGMNGGTRDFTGGMN